MNLFEKRESKKNFFLIKKILGSLQEVLPLLDDTAFDAKICIV